MPKPFCLNRRLNTYKQEKNNSRSLLCRIVTLVLVLMMAMMISDTDDACGEVERKIVQAVGTSTIHKTDVETAKQHAINNGLVAAVDKVVTEILTPELLTQNFRTIDEIIYSKTDTYINDYKVLTEAISNKNYRVLIQANVSVKRLKSRLATTGVMRIRRRTHQNIEIVVQGTRNLSHFINFRRGLKEITGVKTIQVSDMQPDRATILVNFEGSAKEFTDALILKKFEKFSIRIFEISEKILRIELVPG